VSQSVRKNFVFDSNIARYLEELAKDSKKSMTTLVQEMIEERYQELKVKKRMKAFNRIKGSATGLLGDTTIQEIKANREI
jgi:hypothetical protein